jgi:preprotein translocase subunit YajC
LTEEDLSAMYKRTFTREEKLDYSALLDKASEEYHETMRERVESQTEGGLQAKIKKLEEDKRALSVANAFVVASEQAAQTEIIKLQKHNSFLEAHTATVSEHCEAEIGKLEEKTETLTK